MTRRKRGSVLRISQAVSVIRMYYDCMGHNKAGQVYRVEHIIVGWGYKRRKIILKLFMEWILVLFCAYSSVVKSVPTALFFLQIG